MVNSDKKQSSGSISLMSFDTGNGLSEKIYHVDIFMHIIDGTVNIVIDNKSSNLAKDQGIILPVLASCFILPNGCF